MRRAARTAPPPAAPGPEGAVNFNASTLPGPVRRPARIVVLFLIAVLVSLGVNRPAVAGGGDWTDDLDALLGAVLACAEATPARPARVVWAGAADSRDVMVHTRGPQGRRWRCTHDAGTGAVVRMEPDEGAAGRRPRGPVFTPAGQPRPNGECYQHEPASVPAGSSPGWISFDTC